jgi:tRNA dimethylallyltransferase
VSDADRRRLDLVLRVARQRPNALLVLTGPTASGKSALALAAAEALGGEIVSADSVQIVRGFDIGSGKPTGAEQARVRHHLIDALDPLENIDASRFASMADSAIADVVARGHRPILCGGTFLWIRALLYGLVEAPPADEATRRTHRAIVESAGRAALHERLRAVDPESATRLHPNDVVRISRALEVFETTGRKLSELQADHGFRAAKYDAALFAIARTTEELTARISERVFTWLEAGWIDETQKLLDEGYAEARAMGSVGYREVATYLHGEIAREELGPTIVRATRVYARRQRTFLKQAAIEWL